MQRKGWRPQLWFVGALCLAAAQVASGQEFPLDGQWPMEQVRLRNGQTLRGLIKLMGDDQLELAEVQRPSGKPMFLVIRPIDRADIESIERLPENERDVLSKRIWRFRHRARIEARQMENIQLGKAHVGSRRFWTFDGRWFRFESTADEPTTRLCVVRLEQIFLAYRQLLSPRVMPSRQLTLRLYGSRQQYRAFLDRRGLAIENPAFYDAENNLVAAGSDVNVFAGQLRAVERQHAGLLHKLSELDRQFTAQRDELTQQLRDDGSDEAEIRRIRAALLARWTRQREELRQRIRIAERENQARTEEVVQRMLRTLYHEAFHAYLENYVYPQGDYHIPIWLNEGLAQIFETGLLESGTLRIDAPDPVSRATLQADLRSGDALRVDELIQADAGSFLVVQGAAKRTSQRHYAHAWGLAYYLTFEMALLGTDRFDDYVSNRVAANSSVARAERLLGMQLEVFEPKWRAYILGLRSGR